MKKNIFKLGIVLLGLFSILAAYLSYLHMIKGPALAVNPYNRRFQEIESQVRRGSIYDIKGVVLAKTEFVGSKGTRIYPRGADVSHLVGYISERYGRAGFESYYDNYLLGMEGADRFRNLTNKLLGREQVGGDIILTIDSSLQRMAIDLMGGRRGAVVLLDTGTGALRVLASSPSFNPNKLDELWPSLVNSESSPLLNRATEGVYPPGSTYKVVTAAGALSANPDLTGKIFDCPGYLDVNGYRLNDTSAHGELSITRAIAVSCNTTFAQLGLGLGPESFSRTAKAFGMGKDPGLETPAWPGSMASVGMITPTELASSAIGQGEVLVSPLQMAMVAAAIANKGVIMRPYLVEAVNDSLGSAVQKATHKTWLVSTTPETSEIIKEGMIEAVRYGTATAAAVSGMKVAGKTGSAQNPHGQTHAWFIGFAPADQPRVAVAVILENAGSGGSVAAPIGGRLLSAAVIGR